MLEKILLAPIKALVEGESLLASTRYIGEEYNCDCLAGKDADDESDCIDKFHFGTY